MCSASATLASFPETVMTPCKISFSFIFLPTSINILDPPVFQAFLLTKTSSLSEILFSLSSVNAR